MRLQRDDDVILHAEFGGRVRTRKSRDTFRSVDLQTDTIGAHRRKVGAARDQAYLGTRTRQLHSQKSADRAGAKDAYLQRASCCGVCRCEEV